MEQGISRRDLLKRGAVVGGSVLWMTPAVQTFGMSRALAQTQQVSPGGDRCLTVDLLPNTDGGAGNQTAPNQYQWDIVTCNCGVLEISGLFLNLEVVSLSVNGGDAFDPDVVFIENAVIASPNPGECLTTTNQQNIKTRFGLSTGDEVVYTVRATVQDGFGPVIDEETYTAIIV